MTKSFDDLFNEFFKKNNSNLNKEKIEMLLKALTNPLDVDKTNDIDELLGTPDIIQTFENDGLFIRKEIWHTEKGDVVKMIVNDTPFEEEPKKISLEEQLKEALDKEDYETAAKLRDKINSKK